MRTMLLPSRSLGSLTLGTKRGAGVDEVCDTQMNFATLNRFTRLLRDVTNVAACPRPNYRGLSFIRLVSVILRITAQPVLLQYLRTVVDGPRNYRSVRGAGWDPRRGHGPARGPDLRATQPARHHRLKPMKHDLTLDHVKKEARNLLRGLQRRDPETPTQRHAIGPCADMANPALDYARFIIARERGFSSWQELKEIVRSLQMSGYGTLIVLLQKCTSFLRCLPSQNPHNPVPKSLTRPI